MHVEMPFLKLFIFSIVGLLLCSCESTKVTPLASTKIVLIGDSTMAEKLESKRPETGWGEALSPLFDDTVAISNHAVNGRSTKSFIDEGRWDAALAELMAGDILVVEFGHNDQKSRDAKRFAAPWEGYSENLRRFTGEAQAKGADVILLSSICRRKFEENGTLLDTHGEYPAAVKAVALEFGVAFVDMEALSRELLVELGPERSAALFLHLAPGENANYPEGKSDDTHLKPEGARLHAELFVEELRRIRHPLSKLLR
ncbi:GDSL-like lipase/acylhydrolase, putative [Verrucomicrobiia bacterium DG1235]|nr:GDSL-like lipase/acylhydrolase, putative [Verrucomicrobiae bacterium DG1235]